MRVDVTDTIHSKWEDIVESYKSQEKSLEVALKEKEWNAKMLFGKKDRLYETVLPSYYFEGHHVFSHASEMLEFGKEYSACKDVYRKFSMQ